VCQASKRYVFWRFWRFSFQINPMETESLKTVGGVILERNPRISEMEGENPKGLSGDRTGGVEHWKNHKKTVGFGGGIQSQ